MSRLDEYFRSKEYRDKLWKERAKRLQLLLSLDAPEIIIERECLNVLKVRGLWKTIFDHYRSKIELELWYWVKIRFWHSFVLGKSDDEIDEMGE